MSVSRIARRLPLPDEKDCLLLCSTSAGKQKPAAWTLDEPHSAMTAREIRTDLHQAEYPDCGFAAKGTEQITLGPAGVTAPISSDAPMRLAR